MAAPPATTIFLPAVLSAGTPGQVIVVTGTLAAAVEQAAPGDVLQLQPRLYDEGLIDIERAGRADAPIVIRGAGVGETVLRGRLRFHEGAAFWRVQDLTIDVSDEGSGQDGVRLEAPTHDVTLRHVRLVGGRGYGVRVGTDVEHVRIESCEISGFDAGSRDAHGIGIETARHVTVRDCAIHHNSGDGIQVNTPDYPGYDRAASDILIEANQLYDNRENALDVKSTQRLVARGNQMWGARVSNHSDGMAIQIQYGARAITLVGNHVWDAVQGIEITRGQKSGEAYPTVPQQVLVAGNLFRELVADPAGDNAAGTGIVIRASETVRVYNNTVLGAGALGLYLGASGEDDFPQQIDVRNNVLEGAASDLRLSQAPDRFAGLVVDYNHYVTGRVNGGPLAAWLALGVEQHPTQGAPLLDAAWRPLPASPLRDSGVDVGLPYSGPAPDRGWAEAE